MSNVIIGKGSNSTVYEGYMQVPQQPGPKENNRRIPVKKVAVKVVDKLQLTEEKKKDLLQEIKILLTVQNHPSIVHLYHVHETHDHYYLVFEHKSMDLYTFVRKHRPLTEESAKVIFQQLIRALQHCHTLGVCHRDVKIENVLIDEHTLEISLCDFGFATFFRKGERLSKWCGSPHTVAPEIILKQDYDPIAVDLWSAGSVLYTLLCGSFPFQAKTFRDIFHLTTMGAYHPFPGFVSSKSRDLIARLLTVNPVLRLSAQQILAHPWMQQL